MRSTKILKITLVFIFSFCALFLFSDTVYAEEGVAVTGSFTTYEYTLVRGQTLNSPIVDIVFFNNYSHNVLLQLSLDAPDGITIPLDKQLITINANSRLSIPLAITVDSTVPVGEYLLSINASLMDSGSERQTNASTDYVLQSKINVVEQSSQLSVNVLDIKDTTIVSKIYLYRITDNGKSPAGYSATGSFSSALAPGQYEIAAYYNNFKITSKQITLDNNSSLTENLKAETVFINDYQIYPQYNKDAQKLEGINVSYQIENIYTNLENVRITLNILKDDTLIKETPINNFDILTVSKYEANYQYVSDIAFEDGQYEFVLKAYTDSVDLSGNIIGSLLCAQSLPAEMNVYRTKTSLTEIIDIRIILLISLIAIAIGLYLLFRFISKKFDPDLAEDNDTPALDTTPQKELAAPDEATINQKDDNSLQDTLSEQAPAAIDDQCSACNGEEQMVCPECGGSGKIKYGAIEEECMYCSGLGVVLCASCVNRKHLRVCPRCNGDSFTQTDNQKVECTFCNSLGYVLIHQHAKYIDAKKVKLGVNKQNTGEK